MSLDMHAHVNSEKSLSAQFVEATVAAADILNRYGASVVPFKSANDLEFSKLPHNLQALYLSHFRKYVDVLYETHQAGQDLNEARYLVTNMIQKIEMAPVDDILSKIKNSQIVEIYNSENIQIFRNLPFFKVCSYTLDEILSVPWWKLYRREDHVSREIFSCATQILRGEIESTIVPQLSPRHVLEEVASFTCPRMNVDIIFMSPLVSKLNERAILVIEEAELIEF